MEQCKLNGMVKKGHILHGFFPSAYIVWSDILPRLFLRDIDNTPQKLKMAQKRKHIDRAGGQITCNLPNDLW